MDESRRNELQMWCTLLLEGCIEPDDRAMLEDSMRSDPETLAYCQEYFFVWAGLHQPCSVQQELLAAEPVESQRPRVTRSRHRYWAMVAAAVLLLFVGIWWIPYGDHPKVPPVQVAVLEDSFNTKWARSWQGRPDDPMTAGPWQLLQGVAQIRVGTAARVLIQGPCEFSLDNDHQMTLAWGKMTARMLPQSAGFTLITGAARVLDMGTEFGVLAQPFGLSEIHVFDGAVEVSGPTPGGLASVLTEDHAATVDSSGRYRVSGQAQPQRFLRHLPFKGQASCAGTRLDLADIVGGGNGLGTGEIDRGLDPCGGQVVRPNSTRVRDVSCSYAALPFMNYIDGVFVANGIGQPPKITSAGHVFKECPLTDGDYYEGIFNGVKLSVAGTLEFQQGMFDGQPYGTREFPALNLHANAGITFDMDTIRMDQPGIEIDRFTATAGISDTVLQHLQDDDMTDIWVLLDGKVVYYHRFTARGDLHDALDIEIHPADRFLTLVATSDGDSSFSWSFLAEPALELVPDF